MNILVCGGAGYIGSNMTAILAALGHTTTVYDNLSKGHKSAVKDARFVLGDLADEALIIDTLKKYKIEAVFHFAAFIEVAESVKYPEKYHRNNVTNTKTLLSAIQSAGVDKFIFSSSAAVYGNPDQIPITESAPTKPVNPYGQTKLDVENFCRELAQNNKLRYATLRYFNAAGAGGNCTLGEDHDPESHLIPLTIRAAMGKRDDIKIFGSDYPTPDGTCIRDYIHIEDLCYAHLLAMKKLDTQTELIYNLGNGRGYSVRQVIDTVKQISGKNFKVTEIGRRQGDPAILIADSKKIQKELGWKPKYPQLETIVETAWKWHSQNPDGYPD